MAFTDGALGGIASGVGGIISSIFGNKAQRDANRANKEIAQMNNEWSERMMNKQNSFNLAQWQREAQFSREQTQSANAFTEYMQDKANKYNSAKAQADRLREAGLNPALVMSGQNAGSAQGASGAVGSTPSGNSVGLPSPSLATMQPLPYNGFSQAIEGAISVASQLQKNIAETNFINTQSDVMKAKARADLAKMAQETRGLRWNNDFNETTESLRVSNMNEDYLGKLTQRLERDEVIALHKQTRIMNDIRTTYLPDQMKADIAMKMATAEYSGTTDLAKDLKFFEKKYGRRLSKQELKIIFEAWKQNHVYAPTRGMSATGAAATLGNVIGNYFK